MVVGGEEAATLAVRAKKVPGRNTRDVLIKVFFNH
jgi:hypothetical protein